MGLEAGGVICATDAEARAVVEEARRSKAPFPPIGLTGGDLCRTLGGGGGRDLRGPDAVTFDVDLGEVLVDGRLHLFVSHLVARNRWWTRAVVAMNAQWLGPWNLGPKAHPGDALLDTYDAHLPFGDLRKVRARLPTGTHLPHPGITQRRTGAIQVDLDRALPLRLDGEIVGTGRALAIRLRPDALRVTV